MLKILLAEDHNIVRNGIRMLLEMDDNIHIVAEATNGFDVLDMLKKGIEVDLILTDINMPGIDGLTLLKELKPDFSNIRVVILSMHDNENYVTEAFREGVAGYLLKNISSEELLFALKHIHAGGKYLCSEISMKMVDKLLSTNYASLQTSSPSIEFSQREIEVLNLIAEGMTNVEMADKLFISKRTIEGHRQSLIEKTGVRNTASLIKHAIQHGIIQ
jgi:DNA-binding NarL/FixJ family response regulator